MNRAAWSTTEPPEGGTLASCLSFPPEYRVYAVKQGSSKGFYREKAFPALRMDCQTAQESVWKCT